MSGRREQASVKLTVEFYGIPRARAGVSTAVLEFAAAEVLPADVVRALAERFPKLAEECFQGARLRGPFSFNLNGSRFVRDQEVPLRDGDTLLLLSADAGG